MGFVEEIDADEVMGDDELVTDSDGVGFAFSEDEDEEQNVTTLQPKVPFQDRVNAFVGPKDNKFLQIENYFFGLLNTPKLSINDILEGTFDDHEITLITPQSGPPDVVRFQLRNAQRYYENLETRFKGHAETLAFKMACLYFGLPVEPLRVGSTPFDLPADPEPTEEKAVRNRDPLGFLEKYDAVITPVYDETVLSLRGGGDYRKATVEEIKPEHSDIDWNSIKSYFSSNRAPAPLFRLYGWQGAVDARLEYRSFIAQADKLISNWDRVDRSLFVEIWRRSPAKFVEGVRGSTRRRESKPTGDKIWDLVQKYFGKGNTDQYACFIRTAAEGEANRPSGFEPSAEDKHVVRIVNQGNNDVAYLRVPPNLGEEHRPHQFSAEYTRAMQFLLLPGPPHAWIEYQNGLFGQTYQYLDPPGAIFEQIIVTRDFDPPNRITFKVKDIGIRNHADNDFVPIMIPGFFKSIGVPLIKRDEFRTATGLSLLYKFLRACLKNVDIKKDCIGVEVWCPAPDFKYVHEKPTWIALPGNATSPQSRADWERLVAKAPKTSPISLAVRPVYRSYRLRRSGKPEESVLLNEATVQQIKAFVYNGRDPRPGEAILLSPINDQSFQPELTILPTTTEEEWQWIRRNIIEPEFHVTVESLDNEWKIPRNLPPWGPRYVANTDVAKIPRATTGSSIARFQKPLGENTGPAGVTEAPVRTSASNWRISKSPSASDSQGTSLSSVHLKVPGGSAAAPSSIKPENDKHSKALAAIFKNSTNTMTEAERVRTLRARSFNTPDSIFTNPLKPVMPLSGPLLESLIKTGPAMPGVSIAMMTPTEVLRLQREVHQLRYQLLDRTRDCPYADCERYFTFSDGEGLDRHVREDHNVLRCFLCDNEKFLLPHYNADQIKDHFVEYHVGDILRAYGMGGVPVSSCKRTVSDQETVPVSIKKENPNADSDSDSNSDSNSKADAQDLSEPEEDLPGCRGVEKPQVATLSDTSDISEASGSPPPTKKRALSPLPFKSSPLEGVMERIKQGMPMWESSAPNLGPPRPNEAIPPKIKRKQRSEDAQRHFWRSVEEIPLPTADAEKKGAATTTPAPAPAPAPAPTPAPTLVPTPVKTEDEEPTPAKQPFVYDPLADLDAATVKKRTAKPAPTPVKTKDKAPTPAQQLADLDKATVKKRKTKSTPAPAPTQMRKVSPPAEQPFVFDPIASLDEDMIKQLIEKGRARNRATLSNISPSNKEPQVSITQSKVGGEKAEIFTVVNPNPGTREANGAWIKGMMEKYMAEGGKTPHLREDQPGYKLFTALNTTPGTSAENDEFVRRALAAYAAEGNKATATASAKATTPTKTTATATPTTAVASQDRLRYKLFEALNAKPGTSVENDEFVRRELEAYVARGGKVALKGEDSNGRRKTTATRKRTTNLAFDDEDEVEVSGSEVYEYSERSAVSDPVSDLASSLSPSSSPSPSPPAAKRRRVNPPPPTPVAARTARAQPLFKAVELSTPEVSDTESDVSDDGWMGI